MAPASSVRTRRPRPRRAARPRRGHGDDGAVQGRLPHDDPVCPTVSDLFPTSNWHERETREMFGIRFEGHPKQVKLLLSEPFEGAPLRKDFPLMSREAKPWPGAVEGEDLEDEE
ncbi:MAG TPA: NADH-quinone oxidoreductase subunit C [Actinomycetota bacterium]|nr:NADH-quinone oxidoreductase subunit C [Actinomycetota bacterium]